MECGNRAGTQTLGRHVQKPGRHADAVQARNLRGERGIRSVREDEKTGLRGGFGNRRAGKRVSRRCAGLFAGIGDGKTIRRKNGLCIRVQAFFRQSKHAGRRPFGRLAPGEGFALRREIAEGSSKAFFALGSCGDLASFVQC